jgi:hypothetical protein
MAISTAVSAIALLVSGYLFTDAFARLVGLQ